MVRMGAEGTAEAGEETVAERPGDLRRGLALLVAGASFMEFLDGTVIAPATESIQLPDAALLDDESDADEDEVEDWRAKV